MDRNNISILLCRKIFQKNISLNRKIAVQAALQKRQNVETRPFEEIPGLGKFETIKRFSPGGKFYNKSFVEIQESMRGEFGDFYRLPGLFGGKPSVTLFNPNDIEYVHRNEGTYPFREFLETLSYFRKEMPSRNYSVVTGQGEEWYKTRTGANPIMLKPKSASHYIPTLDGIVNEFMQNIPLIQDKNDEMPANFIVLLNNFSIESVVAICLETRLGLMDFNNPNERAMKLMNSVRKIFILGIEFEFMLSVWRFVKTKKFEELMSAYQDLTELSTQIIEDAKKKYDQGVFGQSKGEKGILLPLIKKDMRYATFMIDLIFAGFDTTASALGFTLYCLAKNPDKQEKLRNEILQIIPDKTTPFTEANLRNFPYLRAVIKESMRIYPPAHMNTRRTIENFTFHSYQIPKDVRFIMALLNVYRNPIYFDNPMKFIPERWLRSDQRDDNGCPYSPKEIHPFSFLPFGFGVRACVGKRIAEMELQMFLIRLVSNYRIEWHHPDMKNIIGMVNMPGSELKFKLTKV